MRRREGIRRQQGGLRLKSVRVENLPHIISISKFIFVSKFSILIPFPFHHVSAHLNAETQREYYSFLMVNNVKL